MRMFWWFGHRPVFSARALWPALRPLRGSLTNQSGIIRVRTTSSHLKSYNKLHHILITYLLYTQPPQPFPTTLTTSPYTICPHLLFNRLLLFEVLSYWILKTPNTSHRDLKLTNICLKTWITPKFISIQLTLLFPSCTGTSQLWTNSIITSGSGERKMLWCHRNLPL